MNRRSLTIAERKQVAATTLLAENTIRNWERGSTVMQPATLARIEEALAKLEKKSNASKVA